MGKVAYQLAAGMSLSDKIESFLEGVSLKTLFLSSKKISEEYRLLGRKNTNNEEALLAYLVTRMPATHAVLLRVFQEVRGRCPSITSLLDVGCGPGTVLWAAAEVFTELKQVHCVEKDAQFLAIAKRLAEDLWLYPHVTWAQADMQSALTTPADLVVASYSLGEIDPVKRIAVEETLWSLTQKVLLIVEPGTPKGFNSLRETRKRLLDKGAHLLGPCPHSNACPMASEDWCHFYARLNRSSLHRRAKGAERNYEDEKFSYMAFSREPALQCSSRILRHPRIGKGHVQLTLCTPEGIKDRVATKKDKDLYKLAKKSTWGDTFS